MKEQIRENNVERFAGFGDLYDQNRPKAPQEVVNILTRYLRGKPRTVVDVGCGTGLSSFLWLNEAERVIGVEPNDDMRAVALRHWRELNEPAHIQFVPGLSHQLDLASESADIVTCSQSFHWMEPQTTLREFARILRPGGLFAAYDCDWPPGFTWEIEERYKALYAQAEARARQLTAVEAQPHRWSKEEHLGNIRGSGLFRFAREIVFHHWETCGAERYANIAFSKGGLQTALKRGADELHAAVAAFRDEVTQAFGGKPQEVLFCYRMRLGVK